MLRFRPRPQTAALPPRTSPEDLLAVSQVIDHALQPGHFLAAPALALTWTEAHSETLAWEIFRGRLLEPAQTRLQRTFLSWHVLEQDAARLSVKLDVHTRSLHVTRGLLCHVWEGYDAGGGIESRETVKWTQELVGSILLQRCADLDELLDELICLLWQAMVGTSRLPLTSLEAPLPAFAFGQLHYVYRPEAGAQPVTSWQEGLALGLRAPLSWRERAKLLEFMLRRVTRAELPSMAEVLLAASSLRGRDLAQLLRTLFNEVSLSPYSHFVDHALRWVELLTRTGMARWSRADYLDFLGHVLRQLGRHLTAYDLVTFHHRGANYPDALLLDAALKAYLLMLDAAPDLFQGDEPQGRMRRRALRQGCLLRRAYEGHPVPDIPTSPGENARVLPASHPRVPEEQLTQPHRRRRQLFAGDPLVSLLSESARRVLTQSVLDLGQLPERIELGLGIYLDRPLGYAKAATEPDQTPLLAHEVFSRMLARRRWQELQRLGQDLALSGAEWLTAALVEATCPEGLPAALLADAPRPTVSLADVRRVSDDGVLLRTLPGTLTEFWRLFDTEALQKRFRLCFLAEGSIGWCVQVRQESQPPVLTLADASSRRRLEMRVDLSLGYATRAGVEFPRAGLQVLRVWEDTGDRAVLKQHDLTADPHVLAVRSSILPNPTNQ